VRELLTGYGPIGLMWYDTPRVITKQQSEELAALTHQLQPMCIVSGRVGHDAGDYMSTGDNQVTVGSRRTDWEAPVTLNDTWGFKKDDHNWKTPQVLVQQLVMTASRGGNYLLNVGPTAEGIIPQHSVERLAAVGKWMKANSESIYATQGSPYPYELNWGLVTTKPGRMYLHVFDWPEKELVLYGLQTRVKGAWLLANKRPLKVSQRADRATELNELRIAVPSGAPDPIVSVIVLDMEGRPEVSQELMQQPDGSITLDAFLGDVKKASQPPHLQFDSRGVAERWLNKDESLSWKFRVFRPGEYRVAVLSSEQKYNTNWEGGHTVNVRVAGTDLRGAVERHETVVNPRSPYWNHVLSNIGRVSLQKPGVYDVTLKPESLQTAKKLGLTLVSVRLIPVSAK
jgi:alpha-L-fucosidase